MAQQAQYTGVWSREGLNTSPTRLPRQRALTSRPRSHSNTDPRIYTPRARFASSQLRPVQLFGGSQSPDSSFSDYDESEDSVFFEDSPMVRRHRSEVSPRHQPPIYRPPVSSKRRKRANDPEMTWVALFVRVVIASTIVALSLKVLLTLRHDLATKVTFAKQELSIEIKECEDLYRENHCSHNPGPALTRLCSQWLECKNKDPENIGHAGISAAVVGEIIEAFLGPMDLRSMTVFFILAFAAAYFR